MKGQDPAAIGPYRVLRRLGQGGMGTVYLVDAPGAGAQRALKVLGPGADPDTRRRFRREAEAMARVDDHPGVLRIHSAGEHEGQPYLVMSYAPGGDLSARLRDGPLPPAEVVRLGVDLARGLEHVHTRGVLHRDLKPSNVLFDEAGAPRLVDFGLARVAGAERLTQTGTILGTPGYMAPEQANARQDLDARVDVYGLGALLYHALTGRPPFQGPTAWAVIDRVLRAPLVPPRDLVPGVPAALEAVVLRALARSPDERWTSAAALADALEGSAHAAPPARPRGRLVALGGAIALLAAGLAIGRWPAPSAQDVPAPPPVVTREAPPPPSDPVAEQRATALALLRQERPDEVLALAAAWGPPRSSDPRADVIAAAARLCDDAVPAAWQAVVAEVGSDAAASREVEGFEYLAVLLLRSIDAADLIHGALPGLEQAATTANQLDAARTVAGDRVHPLTIAAALRAQRQVALRAPHLTYLTAAGGGNRSSDRPRRQALVIEVLHTVAALEPESLSADALRVAASVPAIVSHFERAATWETLDRIVEGDRVAALRARYPDIARPLPALWIWATGPRRVAELWERGERRWAEVRLDAAHAFEADGRLLVGSEGWWMQPVIDAAKTRCEAAIWRAWDVRGDEQALAAAVAEALVITDVLADVDAQGRRLLRTRLLLLRGDAAGARAELDGLHLAELDGGATLNLGERLLVEAHLVAGELEAARRQLEQLSSPAPEDPTRWRHQALLLAVEGRHDEADARLAQAARVEPALLALDGVTYSPWWSVAETRKLLAAARARGRWDATRDGLFVRPGE